MYDLDMRTETVSVDLESENLDWLRTAAGGRDLSDTLNKILARARAATKPKTIRSVRGTIRLPESDPDLVNAKTAVRELFHRSVERTAKALSKTGDPKA